MSDAIMMRAKDTLQAAMAQCYVTIGDKRYNFMQAINVELTFTKTKTQIPILGRPGKGNKAVGWNGTGTATFHYNTSVFRKMMKQYKETGEDVYFDMEIINYDPSSAAGRQSLVAIDCNIDGGTLAKFDADGEYLDESMDFTFEDFSIPEEFKDLDGFLVSGS